MTGEGIDPFGFLNEEEEIAGKVEEALAGDPAAKYMQGEELPQLVVNYPDNATYQEIESIYGNPTSKQTEEAVAYMNEEPLPPIEDIRVTDMEKTGLLIDFVLEKIEDIMVRNNREDDPYILNTISMYKDFKRRLMAEAKSAETMDQVLCSVYDQLEDLENKEDEGSVIEFIKTKNFLYFLTNPNHDRYLENEEFLDWAEHRRKRKPGI